MSWVPSSLAKPTQLVRSLAAKLTLLILIFITVPVILFSQFEAADSEKNLLLRRAVEEQGRMISETLRPLLARFPEQSPSDLRQAIERWGGDHINIKLLVRPKGNFDSESLFYVASAPPVSAEYLEDERERLIATGVLNKLEETCDRATDLALRFTNPAGNEEILTSLISVHLDTGCWVLITSQSASGFLQSSLGQPFWRTTTMQIAGFIYLLSAAIVAWLFIDIWKNVDRFRSGARMIRSRGTSDISFKELNTIPELTGIAEEFDGLVSALSESQKFIRQAAEENAHALKGPLAVIAQAVEPLKRSLPSDEKRNRRSLELIERSVERLDSLVSAARDVEKATADVIYPERRPLTMSTFMSRLLSAYQDALRADEKWLEMSISPDITVIGDEDLLEPVVENLLENAASFSPKGAPIEVTLAKVGTQVSLTIADRGPGVATEHLGVIFDRYYSHRPALCDSDDDPNGPHGRHFGLGLWIARRNVEALGGSIIARNRKGGGLAVTVNLIAAE